MDPDYEDMLDHMAQNREDWVYQVRDMNESDTEGEQE